ncbi:kelch-like protein 10 isoform X1 [Paramormyrops kingsleyae]|uniref:Kelch like family member 10 n=2 Tax=Paramormyrops kingsleyae TaxID=1676925 RepID=A0A3B3RX39_9TELE|nr:kelch-like protein 10 isoform X1 [Paramormyrops kingsleyae]
MERNNAWNIFNELRLGGPLCDVVIEVNGVKFTAHKIILCGCSPYFRALFASGWSDTGRHEFSIPDVPSEIMKLVIDYAYTHSVPVTVENVESLLVAADQFDIVGMMQCCSKFLESHLCLENCTGIFNFSGINWCPELRQSSFSFILHNFKEVATVSQEFLELTLPQLCDIIEKDELNVSQEDVVFDAILHWIRHEPASRNAHISVLLSKVRMGRMSADYFMYTLKNNDLLKDRVEYNPLFISTLKAMYNLNMNGPSPSDFDNLLTRPRLPSAILLAISGWSRGSPTNAIEAYDTRADRWVNVTRGEERPRPYHGAAYLDGFVYCIGGFDGVVCFNSVDKFNPVTRKWQEVAPMHSRRCYVSVAVLGGFIYAMGGFDGHMRHNTVERYHPEANQWTQISPMTEQRSDASATALHGKVYICGGFNGVESLFTAECYNPLTDQWDTIAPMTNRRSGIGIVAYNEQIYAVGGFDGSNRLRSMEAYNPLTNRWRDVAAMFNPRSNFGIEVVDGLLFAVGGFNGFTTTTNAEYYDKNADSWCSIREMSVGRSGLSCCVVPALPSITQYAAPRESL